jgi:predicted RNA-binding protein YlqC (UPF0109 family)
MNQVAREVPETAESISNLVATIIYALVDYPDRVSVEVTPEQGHTFLLLQVDPRDVGKVVGKQGRTARSLRTILSAAGMKLKHRFRSTLLRRRTHRSCLLLVSNLFPQFQTQSARRSNEPSRQTTRNRPSESLSPECARNSDVRED